MTTRPPTHGVDTFARFQRADGRMKHRIVAQSVGEVATGKTTFWLGAPGPMVIQTLDQGLEGVVEPFAVKKAIYLASYDLVGKMGSNGFTHALAVEARDKFITDFEHAIGVARTIIWDRGSDVFDLFYFAEFGTDDAFAAAPPKDWDRLKGKIRRLIAMAKASEINFGIIEGMKNEWLSKVNPKTGSKAAVQSGNRIPAGMEGIDGLVHIVLNHTREGKAFNLTVEKSRGPGGGDIQDQTFENLTFVDMAQLVFPGSSESEWT